MNLEIHRFLLTLLALAGAACTTGQPVKTLAQASAEAVHEQARHRSDVEPAPPLLILHIEARPVPADR